MIVLEMKCPQLSKPEATAGKERKLHRWQNGEKTLGETRLSRGASSPTARQISSLFQLQQSQSVSGPLVPGSFPDGCLGDEVLTGDLSLGLISEGLSSSLLRCSVISMFKGRIQTEACVIPNYHGMLIPWQ